MGNKLHRCSNPPQLKGSSNFKTTEWLTEERDIVWQIKNFTAQQATKAPQDKSIYLKFRAGASIKQPSSWTFEFKFNKDNGGMALFLCLDKRDKAKSEVFASFQASIKDPKDSNTNVQFKNAGIEDYIKSSTWGYKEFVTLEQLHKFGALENDTLTIHLNFVLYGDEVLRRSGPSWTTENLNHSAENEIVQHLRILLKTGKGSDFLIRVKASDSDTYIEKKVHKSILVARSPVFERMLSSPLLENESGSVTIADLSPQGLDILLEFVYTGKVHNDWRLLPEEIVNASEKYDLPLLKSYCDETLHTAATKENAFTLLNLAKLHGLSSASSNLLNFIKVENIIP